MFLNTSLYKWGSSFCLTSLCSASLALQRDLSFGIWLIVSKNCVITGKFSSRKVSFMGRRYSSRKRTPLARFCRIFDTSMRLLRCFGLIVVSDGRMLFCSGNTRMGHTRRRNMKAPENDFPLPGNFLSVIARRWARMLCRAKGMTESESMMHERKSRTSISRLSRFFSLSRSLFCFFGSTSNCSGSSMARSMMGVSGSMRPAEPQHTMRI
mmetsp:Transcript_2416/g.8624  ORF Transcript_2416/g.8624 Transcript_2416/m.8624 type:complete len:210 (+) Transcript_2416:1944-2573(+)